MVEKGGAGVPGAAEPRRSSYPLKRDYDEYRSWSGSSWE